MLIAIYISYLVRYLFRCFAHLKIRLLLSNFKNFFVYFWIAAFYQVCLLQISLSFLKIWRVISGVINNQTKTTLSADSSKRWRNSSRTLGNRACLYCYPDRARIMFHVLVPRTAWRARLQGLDTLMGPGASGRYSKKKGPRLSAPSFISRVKQTLLIHCLFPELSLPFLTLLHPIQACQVTPNPEKA